jgi:hypothetical protein
MTKITGFNKMSYISSQSNGCRAVSHRSEVSGGSERGMLGRGTAFSGFLRGSSPSSPKIFQNVK